MEHAVTAIIDNLQKLLYSFYLTPIKKTTYKHIKYIRLRINDLRCRQHT